MKIDKHVKKNPEGSNMCIQFHLILQFAVLQRLRTENRLLKQRIETLEKVSAAVT